MINVERYWNSLFELAEITDPNQPYTRRSFSELFLDGRQWLTIQMESAGLTVSVDAAGNLIGKKLGKNSAAGSIMIGSHSDTVPSGGRFDGIAGVIAGLECARTLQDLNIELEHDLEIIDFLAEEPSEWGISCVGSRGITGFLSEALLNTAHPKSSESLRDAIIRVGGKPDQLSLYQHIAAFLELHIEQGCILETERKDIGVVTGIVGIVRLSIELVGQANHAGTTPMNLRKDTANAAAEIMLKVESLAQQYAQKSDGYFVATCGQIFNHPNASNVVPGRTQLVLDIRSDMKHWVEEFLVSLLSFTEKVAEKRQVELTQFERLTDTIPMTCDAALIESIENACQKLDYSYIKMASGAGHDAAFMSHIAPSSMIFVPSVLGKSHCPEEWTEQTDLCKGVAVLMESLLEIDKTI